MQHKDAAYEKPPTQKKYQNKLMFEGYVLDGAIRKLPFMKAMYRSFTFCGEWDIEQQFVNG